MKTLHYDRKFVATVFFFNHHDAYKTCDSRRAPAGTYTCGYGNGSQGHCGQEVFHLRPGVLHSIVPCIPTKAKRASAYFWRSKAPASRGICRPIARKPSNGILSAAIACKPPCMRAHHTQSPWYWGLPSAGCTAEALPFCSQSCEAPPLCPMLQGLGHRGLARNFLDGRVFNAVLR